MDLNRLFENPVAVGVVGFALWWAFNNQDKIKEWFAGLKSSTESGIPAKWLVIAVAVWFVYTNRDWFLTPSPSTVVVEVASPSDELKAVVGRLKTEVAAKADPEKRARFAAGWRDFGWVASRDTSTVTAGEWQRRIGKFEVLFLARTDLQGAFPGFSAEANTAALSYLGAEDAVVDSKKVGDFLTAVGWAMQ